MTHHLVAGRASQLKEVDKFHLQLRVHLNPASPTHAHSWRTNAPGKTGLEVVQENHEGKKNKPFGNIASKSHSKNTHHAHKALDEHTGGDLVEHGCGWFFFGGINPNSS